MKVAIVCPYDLELPGGVQQVCRDLVGQLRGFGEEAVLVGPGQGEGWVSVGGTVSLRSNRSRVPIALRPAVWRKVADAVKGSDLVHVHEPLLPLVGPAALRAGLPVVATFHADPARSIRTLYRRGSLPISRVLGRAVITAVSSTAASALPRRWWPIRVIPNGVDVGALRTRKDKVPGRVLFLGRDDPRKGFDVLARAWPAVSEAVPEAHLEVAGFERRAQLPETTFLGRVDDERKRTALSEAAIVAIPNLGAESFGIVLVEAMAAGAAVVASDLPAFRDVAGDVAIFRPAGDSAALGAALVELLSNDAQRSELGRRAADRAAAFDWPAIGRAYRDLYLEVLESR